ncbi:MAG: ORF6N domain-containing protein [Steroidobacterales bacterium]
MAAPAINITALVRSIRGRRVLLDADLAALYRVTTKRLNEQVKRNRQRFPDDFAFALTGAEFRDLKSQIATSSWGGRRKLPFAFTEHGAIMAATVLNSSRAIEMTVHVVRAFVKFRELLASNDYLARKLAALERSVLKLDTRTQRQFAEIYDIVRALTATPSSKRRPIGFTANLDQDP